MDHISEKRFASIPLDARKVRTREALSHALVALLQTTSLEEISVRDITNQAGTGYATFFRHYATKGALLNDVAEALTRQLMEKALPYLGSGTRAAALAMCRNIDEQREVWSALLSNGAADVMRQELLNQVKKVPISVQESSAWMPTELRLRVGVCSTVEIISWWLESGGAISLGEVAEILDVMVMIPTMS
jgi:AcrR family transcriptional regulator